MKKLFSLFVPLLALILALPQSAWATSPTKSVDVYQNATKSITKILYYLPTNVEGKDGKTYSAIDMGYGVAWADKNIGADAEDEAGTYFYWGDIEGHTTFSSSQALDVSSGYSSGTELPVEQDAAYNKIGSNWRIPTPDDFIALRDNTIKTNNEKFTSNAKDNYIIIPGKGVYKTSYTYNGYQHYWTNSFAGKTSSYGVAQIFSRTDDNDYYILNTLADEYNYARCYFGMPIRAIYKPSFTIRTLTIHINGKDMVYKCEDGQTISVNAVANTAEKYVFDKWSDDNSTSATRDFVMTGGDLETTATFKDDPAATTHTVTFKDYDGTTLNTYSLIEGRTPDYRGETISRVGYEFTGWTPSITPLGNADVTYTATYKKQKLFTITNTHASNATTVAMQRSSSSSLTPTFNVRILDKDDNVTTNWTSKTFSGTTATAFGSIPAGGRMEIYGNNSSGLSNYNYQVKFSSITGGTPEISGNILSLVACSDGISINNNFELTAYCFNRLFNSTSIVNAEDLELPSTTLSEGAYYQMFMGCASLSKAPKILPATTISPRCYYQMFQNCTALTKSPDIYGVDISGSQPSSGSWGAMGSMFSGCSALANIRIYLPNWYDINTYGTHLYWCGSVASSNAVAANGILYCPPTLQRKFGAQPELSWDYCHYMPQGNSTHWSTIYSYNITFVAKGGNWSDATSYNKQFTWKTDVSDVNSFLDTESPEGYYTDAACTTPITITEIRALLGTQQEDDVETTKYIYAKFASSSTLTVTVASNNTAFGTVNESEINGVESGTGITVSGSTLTIGSTTVTATKHADDAQYTYAFTGWTDDEGEDLPETVTGGLTIRANFTQTTNTYDITWKSEDGTSTLETDNAQAFGAGTTYNGDAPTKTVTGYTYTFDGWATEANGTKVYNNGETPAVSGAATYYAHFTGGVNTYTIIYNGLNGATNSNPETYTIESVAITLQAPGTRDGYTFTGWTDDDNSNAAVTSIPQGSTGNRHFTANWTEVPAGTPHIDLYDDAAPKKDNVETDNATLLSSYPIGGTKSVDVTLHRKFTAKLWNTICLPFDFDTYGSVLNGKVFEMDRCTTSQDGMSISFLPVTWKEEEKTEMLAGQPYLVWTDTQIDEINFTGVQFKTFTAGTTLADPYGDVEFRAVFEDGYLTRKSSIFIGNGNHLYYAKQTDPGSRIRGYRGYFEIIKLNELEYTTPRVRIVINGEEVMSSEDNDTADIETRKYIEDGVLIIERGGVRYDAQGKRLE